MSATVSLASTQDDTEIEATTATEVQVIQEVIQKAVESIIIANVPCEAPKSPEVVEAVRDVSSTSSLAHDINALRNDANIKLVREPREDDALSEHTAVSEHSDEEKEDHQEKRPSFRGVTDVRLLQNFRGSYRGGRGGGAMSGMGTRGGRPRMIPPPPAAYFPTPRPLYGYHPHHPISTLRSIGYGPRPDYSQPSMRPYGVSLGPLSGPPPSYGHTHSYMHRQPTTHLAPLQNRFSVQQTQPFQLPRPPRRNSFIAQADQLASNTPSRPHRDGGELSSPSGGSSSSAQGSSPTAPASSPLTAPVTGGATGSSPRTASSSSPQERQGSLFRSLPVGAQNVMVSPPNRARSGHSTSSATSTVSTELVPYPLVYVSPAGSISCVLNHDVIVEMAVDRSVRVVLHDHFAAVCNARGTSSAILHPHARILHTEEQVFSKFIANNEKMAVFGPQGVLFTMSHLSEAYLVNSGNLSGERQRASAVALDQLHFPSMDDDYTIKLFYTESQTGQQFIALCKDIVNEATYDRRPDGSLYLHINGMLIRQSTSGDVIVDARPRQISCSPRNKTVHVRSGCIDMALEENERGYVKRGHKRVHVSRSGMVVSDGNCITSMDHFGRIVCCN